MHIIYVDVLRSMSKLRLLKDSYSGTLPIVGIPCRCLLDITDLTLNL